MIYDTGNNKMFECLSVSDCNSFGSYTVPKKETREFRRGSAPSEWGGVQAALQYLDHGVLPPHWDRDTLFNEPRNTSDDVRIYILH